MIHTPPDRPPTPSPLGIRRTDYGRAEGRGGGLFSCPLLALTLAGA